MKSCEKCRLTCETLFRSDCPERTFLKFLRTLCGLDRGWTELVVPAIGGSVRPAGGPTITELVVASRSRTRHRHGPGRMGQNQ